MMKWFLQKVNHNWGRSICLILLFIAAAGTARAQTDFNLSLLSNPPDNCEDGFNDVWGFEHSNGTNFAILGTRCGTSIYNIADPAAPILVVEIPGAAGVWRDIKNWGDKIYVVADQGNTGLQVIDMTDPSSIPSWSYHPKIGEDSLMNAHNLYIDDLGLLYVAGCRQLNEGGVLILDLYQDDSIPPVVGLGPPVYAHDVFYHTGRNVLVTSDIYERYFSLHTLSIEADTILVNTVANQETGGAFTHNVWTSEDGNIAYTTDEVGGAYVEAWDISDHNDIVFLDKYAPYSTLGNNVAPHNVHVKGDHLIISYYQDGVKIVDASRPSNLVEIGAYDTDPGAGTGCWGAFPFFTNNLILASDINNGLFVLQPDYTAKASYLEGVVKDSEGGLVDSAVVQILAHDHPFDHTGQGGDFALGIVDQTTLPENGAGRSATNILQVQISKSGYETKDTIIEFVPGTVHLHNFVLESTVLHLNVNQFQIENKNCSNEIKWQTEYDNSVDHFILERSTDGVVFLSMETFHPTEVTTRFNYFDKKVELENFYRIKQIDLDGDVFYSNVLHVRNHCDQAILFLPNPTYGAIDILSAEKIQRISVYNKLGMLVLKSGPTQSNKLDLQHLPGGSYFIQIQTSEGNHLEKIVKL